MGSETTVVERVAIIGSSGSIGTQALDVIVKSRGRLEVAALAVHRNIKALKHQCVRFDPECVAISDADAAREFSFSHIRKFAGSKAIIELVTNTSASSVLFASGTVDELPAIQKAIQKRQKVLIATKEVLAIAGDLLVEQAKNPNALIPIDSELTSLWSIIAAFGTNNIESVLITASGGRFWQKEISQLANVGIQEAIAHPRWKMGKKVSVDSATLVNKAIEVAAACRTFGFETKKVEVLIHPQAMCHASIAYADGANIPVFGSPDMHTPISRALNANQPIPLNVQPMQWTEPMEFHHPKGWVKEMIELGFEAASDRGKAVALIAADDAAVDLFLQDRISLLDVAQAAIHAVEHPPRIPNDANMDEILTAYLHYKDKVKDELTR